MWKVALCAVLFSAPAGDAGERFREAFGDQVDAVTRTPQTDDDVRLADLLIDASGRLADDRPLARECARVAFDLARREPAAYETALRALDARKAAAPDDEPGLQAQKVEVLQRAFTTQRDRREAIAPVFVEALERLADRQISSNPSAAMATLRRAASTAAAARLPDAERLKAKVREAAEVVRWNRRADQLKTQLRADPENKEAATELVMLLVTKIDAPERAGRYSFLLDEPLKQRVTTAAKPIDTVDEAVCLEMGRWYSTLAGDEPASTRAPLLRRAAAYVERYLAGEPEDQVQAVAAELLLGQIRSQMVGPEAARPDGWISLLGGGANATQWKQMKGDGTFESVRGGLMISGDATLVHAKELGDVELIADIKPVNADDIKIGLRDNSKVSLYVTIRKKRVILRIVDLASGRWKPGEDIGRLPDPREDGTYSIKARLGGGKFSVQINGEPVAERAVDASIGEAGRPMLGTSGAGKCLFMRVKVKPL